jgi:hypothetical protein
MEQRLESSTLIALRELRSYEQERRLAERRKREEEVRQARERKERERQVEESARERALENQLRMDLQRTQEEVARLRLEADRHAREATRPPPPSASVASALALPVPAVPVRRGKWLAWGCTAILAGALVLLLGVRRNSAVPAQYQGHNLSHDFSCPAPTVPAPLKAAVPSALAPPMTSPQTVASGSVELNLREQRLPAPHPRVPAASRPIRKPKPPKPICDGTDPLCGLDFKSNAP